MKTDYRQAVLEAIGGVGRSTAYVPFRSTCVINRYNSTPCTVCALKAWTEDGEEHVALCDRIGREVTSLDKITEESQKMVFYAITAD